MVEYELVGVMSHIKPEPPGADEFAAAVSPGATAAHASAAAASGADVAPNDDEDEARQSNTSCQRTSTPAAHMPVW
jgi:hypothetical protein